MHAEKIGTKGPHLIMLHGWGQSSKNLFPLGELLSSEVQVHLIDLPGFGLSEPPPEIWNSFQYADHLVDYLDKHQIEDAYFLGHSFGGKVALSAAVRYPKRVKRLILMASSGLKRSRTLPEKIRFQSIRYFGKMLKGFDRFAGTDLFRQWFSPLFGSTDYLQADQRMRAVLVKSVNEDISPLLHAIEAPTLILWGDKDQETPLEVAKRFQTLIKNSQLFVFEGKNHCLYQECGSHLCTSYILSWLRG